MLANWIKLTTTTTGTGNLAFTTTTNYPAVTSQIATNERVAYSVVTSSGEPLERGIGYHDGSGNWVRERVLDTFISGVYVGGTATAGSLPSGTKYLLVSPGAQTMLTARQGVWAGTLKGYGDMGLVAATGSYTGVADRAVAIPACAAVDSDIDGVMFRVTTAGAASTQAKCAIFSVGSDGLPDVKLAEGAAVAVDSTGVKTSTFTRFKPPPAFFVCFLTNGAPVIQGQSTGIIAAFGMGASSSLIPNGFIHHVGAASLTFPTTWTAVGNAANTARPGLYMRCP